MKTLILTLFCAASMMAQTKLGDRIFEGLHDTSTSTKVTSPRLLSSEPGTCDATKREVYYNTTTNKLRVCNTTNTWSDLSGGGLAHGTYYVTDNGTKYLSDHMAYAATSPPSSGWSWFSVGGNSTQDSATYTSTAEGVLRITTGGSTYTTPHLLSRTRTGTTLTVALNCASGMNIGSGTGTGGCWVGLGNASGGGYILVSWDGPNGDNWYVHVNARKNDGTLSPLAGVFMARQPRFMRVVVSGSDASFWVSYNGIDFKSLWNETMTTHFPTADVWLIGAHSVNSGNQGPDYVAFDSFIEQ